MRVVLGGTFALLFTLSFPFRAGQLAFDLGLVAGWIALVPFAFMLRGLGPRAAFAWGTASATLAFCGVLFWIYHVVHVEGGMPPAVGVLALLLLSLACALHVGLAAACSAWLEAPAGRLAFAVLPSAWVAAEHLRSFSLLSGFPWAYLGHSAHANGPALSLLPAGGVFLLSFAMALFAVLISRGRATLAMALLAGLHAIGFTLGLWQLPQREIQGEALQAALVQGNVPQGLKWDPARARDDFEAHQLLSRLGAAEGDLDLIIWPEASATFFLDVDDEARDELRELARETGATLVLGSLGLERPPLGRPRFFNSAFSVDPELGFTDRYDKAKLVPFGEYVPLQGLLSFIGALAHPGYDYGEWTQGPGPRALRGLPDFRGDHALVPLICYEVVYPKLVREAVQGGAGILLNLTNDAWYGWSSAPEQFLAIAATRSAEHGLPMLRAANTGVTAVIDAGGRIRAQTQLYERTVITAAIPPSAGHPTLYTRVGDWPVQLSWLLIIAIGGFQVVRSRRGDQGNPRGPSGSRRARRGAPEASLTSTANDRD